MRDRERRPEPQSEPADKLIGTSKRDVYRAARTYVKSGLSLIPIRADGTKMPAFELLPRTWNGKRQRTSPTWICFKSLAPTPAELQEWFLDSEGEYGFAVLGGQVSGCLEIIDCDNWNVGKRWSALVKEKSPELFRQLVRVRTPRPGLHAYYRCPVFGGSRKLARSPDPEDMHKPKTIIELKGEGGYCLAPPSPPACHKSGRSYTFLGNRTLVDVPTIGVRDRDLLLACARELDLWPNSERREYVPPAPHPGVAGTSLRPGDDYNLRADWGEILIPKGWTFVGSDGADVEYWCRPGKRNGVSATTNYANSGVLYVFSSNAEPFDEDAGYTKFRAFALLNHDGDFSAAARELARLGFGTPSPTRHRRRRKELGHYGEMAKKMAAIYG